MSDLNETNQLLTQIRDILASREQLYKDYIEGCKKTYAEQVEANRLRSRGWLTWVFIVVFAAVYLACILARVN